MTQTENPWAGISPAGERGLVSARRVDASGRWNFFWARDNEHRPLLLLRHGVLLTPAQKLPVLKGLELVRLSETDDQQTLIFRLVDATLVEPFSALCLDLIRAANLQETEGGAVSAAIGRSWRWHYLLRGGLKGLGFEQIKGLIGELVTLRDIMIPRLGPMRALEAWRGPLGGTHDFLVDDIAVECKVRRGAQSDHVAISSEHQLDSTGVTALFLRIISMEESTDATAGSFTLSDLINAICTDLAPAGSPALDLFGGRLEAAGVRSDEDYGNDFWTLKNSLVVQVGERFPKLIPPELPGGISGVTYKLSVGACAPFVVDQQDIWASCPAHGA